MLSATGFMHPPATLLAYDHCISNDSS